MVKHFHTRIVDPVNASVYTEARQPAGDLPKQSMETRRFIHPASLTSLRTDQCVFLEYARKKRFESAHIGLKVGRIDYLKLIVGSRQFFFQGMQKGCLAAPPLAYYSYHRIGERGSARSDSAWILLSSPQRRGRLIAIFLGLFKLLLVQPPIDHSTLSNFPIQSVSRSYDI